MVISYCPRFRRHISLFLLMCLISSCVAVPTKYIPQGDGQYGFSSRPLGDSTYRVTFYGNAQTTPETVDRYALYRAAELTKENGGTYFEIIDDKSVANVYTTSGGTVSSDANATSATQPAGSVFPNTTTATATTTSSYGSSSYTEHTVTKTIRVHSGFKPDSPNSYRAQAILDVMQEQLSEDNGVAGRNQNAAESTYLIYDIAIGVVSVVMLVLIINGLQPK